MSDRHTWTTRDTVALLRTLEHSPGSAHDIALNMRRPSSTIGRQLGNLERAGMVERRGRSYYLAGETLPSSPRSVHSATLIQTQPRDPETGRLLPRGHETAPRQSTPGGLALRSPRADQAPGGARVARDPTPAPEPPAMQGLSDAEDAVLDLGIRFLAVLERFAGAQETRALAYADWIKGASDKAAAETEAIRQGHPVAR